MAGSPQKRERRERLDAAEEEIIDALATPATLNEIAARYGVSRGVLSRWMEEERRADACARARARAADAMAERAVENAQSVLARAVEGRADKVEVAAVKVATDIDRWIAGVWNREKYGEQRGAVTINFGVLHLDALRKPQAALQPAERAVEALPGVTALHEPQAALQPTERAVEALPGVTALHEPQAALQPAERAVEALPGVADVQATEPPHAATQHLRLEDLL